MKGLKWIQSAFSTSFYLSISDLFSYVRPNSTDSTQIYTPNGTKVTGKIDVSNTPDIIQVIWNLFIKFIYFSYFY